MAKAYRHGMGENIEIGEIMASRNGMAAAAVYQ